MWPHGLHSTADSSLLNARESLPPKNPLSSYVSAASARGLTQFVYPTAARIGKTVGLERLAPTDLERPEVAILLGAAYIDELRKAYDGAIHQAVAAYNAGEAQSQLWRSYCLSDDPAEYFTKVAFRETRNYLARVLSSAAQYRDLYF